MNGTSPPPLSSKDSSLATWSLVLSILSLFCLGFLAGVPAVICGHNARSRIRRSAGELSGEGVALAGLITGYIGIALSVLIFPLMLAIAIPNFVKARSAAQTNQCIGSLRQIDAVKKQWASEKKKQSGDTPTREDLQAYFPNGFPACPNGGTYSIGSVAEYPTCSIAGHRMN